MAAGHASRAAVVNTTIKGGRTPRGGAQGEGDEVSATPRKKAVKKKEKEKEDNDEKEGEEEEEEKSALRQAFDQTIEILNSTSLQTFLYMTFVIIFQTLADTVRMPQEYYFDKHVMDRLVENMFDSNHNTFNTVRRIADVYEWGNNVLIPGMFADMGPCSGSIGLANTYGVKGCNDDAWPDGEGSFHMEDASPLTLDELVKRMDQFDCAPPCPLLRV